MVVAFDLHFSTGFEKLVLVQHSAPSAANSNEKDKNKNLEKFHV